MHKEVGLVGFNNVSSILSEVRGDWKKVKIKHVDRGRLLAPCSIHIE